MRFKHKLDHLFWFLLSILPFLMLFFFSIKGDISTFDLYVNDFINVFNVALADTVVLIVFNDVLSILFGDLAFYISPFICWLLLVSFAKLIFRLLNFLFDVIDNVFFSWGVK